ncbi:hypothetical protein TNCT_655231 [Trichonephila clavata]|uniref:Uncharacterized protein n=1 Tax=Trichonephila clavata TaxID=2740835 RepID=A0A8X6HQW0_TRICU|nr:hypothetical protein TNCT_655231 [Trichonephila clavata]
MLQKKNKIWEQNFLTTITELNDVLPFHYSAKILSGGLEINRKCLETIKGGSCVKRQNEKEGRLMRADDDTLIGIDEKQRRPPLRTVGRKERKHHYSP